MWNNMTSLKDDEFVCNLLKYEILVRYISQLNVLQLGALQLIQRYNNKSLNHY